MEHLFHILYSKDSNLLQCIGIFRVQPGIPEVGLVEDARELGKLQQVRKCCHYIRMPENASVANLRVFLDKLAAMILQTPANLPVLYLVGSLEKVFYIYAAWVLRPLLRVSVWVFQMALRQNLMVNSLTMRFSTKICLVALLDAILSISD